jgi:hypothetical protein
MKNWIRAGIETKFLGPTNNRGSRVKATCQAGSLTLSWSYELNSDENHYKAAQALADKFSWSDYSIGCSVPSNKNGYVFMATPKGLI